MGLQVVQREDKTFERVVMAELLIPDTPNSYGDIYTRDSIKEFVYEFARQGHGLDVDHDQVNVDGKEWIVVESFIARPGDPNFIEGSWVIGAKILSDTLWQRVMDGDINGFSFQADCWTEPVVIQNLANRQVTGLTEPDPIDGHQHTYLVILDPLNVPIAGGTGETDGHSHKIATHTVTMKAISIYGAGEHSHRYQVIVPEGEENAG